MIPWHLLKQNTVDLLFELIKNAIESLKYHVSRPSSQIDKNLLSRMISTALHYPAFSVVQKQHFIQEKVNRKLKFQTNIYIFYSLIT
jgi:hypothetical protein